MKQNILSTHRGRAVLEDLLDCYTWAEIRERHSVSNRYVQRVSKLLPPHKERSGAVAQGKARRVARMLKSMSQREVAERLGMDQTTVSKYALAAGHSTAEVKRDAIAKRRRRVNGLLSSGKSVREIAALTNVSVSTVYSDIGAIAGTNR